jgi:hypothetical protein
MRAERLGKKCRNPMGGWGRLQGSRSPQHAILPIMPAVTGETGDAAPPETPKVRAAFQEFSLPSSPKPQRNRPAD